MGKKFCLIREKIVLQSGWNGLIYLECRHFLQLSQAMRLYFHEASEEIVQANFLPDNQQAVNCHFCCKVYYCIKTREKNPFKQLLDS